MWLRLTTSGLEERSERWLRASPRTGLAFEAISHHTVSASRDITWDPPLHTRALSTPIDILPRAIKRLSSHRPTILHYGNCTDFCFQSWSLRCRREDIPDMPPFRD